MNYIKDPMRLNSLREMRLFSDFRPPITQKEIDERENKRKEREKAINRLLPAL